MSERLHTNDEQEIQRLEKIFTHHPPKGNQPQRYTTIRNGAHVLARVILRLVPPGRERSLAFTKLEEVVMAANAGIARGEADPSHSGTAETVPSHTEGYRPI